MRIKLFKNSQEDELNKFLGETDILQINYQPDYIAVLYEDNSYLKNKLQQAENNLIEDKIALELWKEKVEQKRGGQEQQMETIHRMKQAERKVEEDKSIIHIIKKMLKS